MKILGVIPARGGSKGLERKNILPLLGKPLVAWTIEQALRSKYLDRVLVSTDDDTIAQVSQMHGAEVPFLRPKEFAQDHSPTSDAVLHALSVLKQNNESYDYIALLEPTSPLRRNGDIDTGVKLLLDDPTATSLVSAGEVHTEHPLIVKRIEDGRLVPYMASGASIYQRQQADKAYFPYGVLYCAKVETYLATRTFYTSRTIPMLIERWQNYEIDDEIDWAIVETIMKAKIDKISGG